MLPVCCQDLSKKVGVNYYLTGLHSYATGDPVPIPNFVYVTVLILIALSVVSIIKYRGQRKLHKEAS